MRRAAATIAALLLSCAAEKPVAAPSPIAIASIDAGDDLVDAAEDVAIEDADGAPSVRAEIGYDEARTRGVEDLRLVARNVYDAFSNVEPRPVTRGFTKATWVQYESDRRERGVFEWLEAPTVALHGAAEKPEKLEPCAYPIEPGGERSTTWGAVFLERTSDHDALVLRPKGQKQVVAKLARGSSHGACLGPDATRVWIGWSTPLAPPEVYSVAIRDGSPRPLRADARPGLAAIPDAKAFAATLGDGSTATVIVPNEGDPRATAVVDATRAPLARWDPFARFLAGAGIAVVLAPAKEREAAIAFAASHWHVPLAVVASSVTAPPRDAPLIVLVGGVDPSLEPVPPRTSFIGVGEASRAAIEAAIRAAPDDATWTVATGRDARAATSLAWARAAEAILAPRR